MLAFVFLFPWWGVGILAAILVWQYRNYYEAVFFGVLLDALYLGDAEFGWWFTLGACLLMSVGILLRKQLRMYEPRQV